MGSEKGLGGSQKELLALNLQRQSVERHEGKGHCGNKDVWGINRSRYTSSGSTEPGVPGKRRDMGIERTGHQAMDLLHTFSPSTACSFYCD